MRHHPNSVMIFCAGRGTRMKALTQDRPKPMIEVAGKPLVDHALEQLEGVEHRVANLHYLPDMLEQHLGALGVKTVFEPTLLETGGGLKNALPMFSTDTLFTMNTDAVWNGPRAAEILSKAWDPDRMDALLLVVPMARTHAHLGTGDFDLSGEGRISRGNATVYTGMQILKTEAVAEIEDDHFSLNIVWENLFRRGRIFGVEYPGDWVDVGHPDGIEIAETLLKAKP
ncbi:nucleotidyltransferase family protein [Celeribacter litoreus]|uniref:nucleotidyltransferase family protein n=1 Tax=Celeribacter litoreus TaxID=2876714 RepID=UPI001CCF55C5|nr:nucleotidyltransferase family protein [Celeribacter litoreus]MCA0042161.1 nucleotidyltransferase family protein [Celeribacter litoreus]